MVIIDVLRFGTAVAVAVANGALVYPSRHADASAFAQRIGSPLADGSPYSLSPATLTSIPSGTRLVLPPPNGATLALLATELGIPHVFAGCLGNASVAAAAIWLSAAR